MSRPCIVVAQDLIVAPSMTRVTIAPCISNWRVSLKWLTKSCWGYAGILNGNARQNTLTETHSRFMASFPLCANGRESNKFYQGKSQKVKPTGGRTILKNPGTEYLFRGILGTDSPSGLQQAAAAKNSSYSLLPAKKISILSPEY